MNLMETAKNLFNKPNPPKTLKTPAKRDDHPRASDIYKVPARPKAIPPRVNGQRVDDR
jgi:hypothetical protein